MWSRWVVVALCAVSLAGCGNPVSYSAPVGINLKAKSDDASSGTVTAQKGISTESGNPFKVFVDEAKRQLDGKSPSRVELDELTLTLGAQSTGVTSLAEVFTGRVDALFLTDESNNTYAAGHVENPTGGGPVQMTIDFDSDDLPAADYTRFLEGKFKVVLRGPATAGFSGKGAEAAFQLTPSFTAFE